jgi:hypothetical protein
MGFVVQLMETASPTWTAFEEMLTSISAAID